MNTYPLWFAKQLGTQMAALGWSEERVRSLAGLVDDPASLKLVLRFYREQKSRG